MEAVTELNAVSNDGASTLLTPYTARVVIRGMAPLLFHRWSVDGVEAKSRAAKGSKAKKEDDLESYVYRLESGNLAIPGEYLRMSIVNAARFRQDPRSPRKSALDLAKAGIITLDELCDLGVREWDYVDRRRVMIQRNGITRHRPAMKLGWQFESHLMVNLPEYISQELLMGLLSDAGRLIGVGDFRPTFGRFSVTAFEVVR